MRNWNWLIKNYFMESIGMISLNNQVLALVYLEVEYLSNNSWVICKNSKSFGNGLTETIYPDQLGCPDGATIRIYVRVVWGDDLIGLEEFNYQSNSTATANYVMDSGTLDNQLIFLGVTKKPIPHR